MLLFWKMSEPQTPIEQNKTFKFQSDIQITFDGSIWDTLYMQCKKINIIGLNVTLWIFGPHCKFPWRQNQPLPTSTVNYCPFLILFFFHSFLQIFPSAEARRRVSLITNRLHFTNCIKVDKMTRYDLNKVYKWLFPKIYSTFYWMRKFDSLGGVQNVRIKSLKMK